MILKMAINKFLIKFAEDQPQSLADIAVRASKKIHSNIERRRELKKIYSGKIPRKQDTSTFGAIGTLIKLK